MSGVSICGVLALQGDWEAHRSILRSLGAVTRTVRTIAELETVDALVMPGGESTAMLKLMQPENLAPALTQRIEAGMPVLATCAGVILLARSVAPEQESLAVLAVDVERNSYGRQVHSMVAEVQLVEDFGAPGSMEGVFIRAPRITKVDDGVSVLGTWQNDPVLVRQGPIIAATFHPELTGDSRIHEYFLKQGEA